MAMYLLKTEPSDYSFADLKREKRCVWSGVANPAALIALRAMKKGDHAYIYHTGDDKAIVGVAKAVSNAYGDPAKPETNERGEWKYAVVDLAPVRDLKRPISLATIKADARLGNFALVRQSRLSVMAVPAEIEKVLLELEDNGGSPQPRRRG
jgi:predicted RNA-binding protein with PUA-like domain